MNENTSFKQYLNECGYGLMEYQEQVYKACLTLGNYTNIDLYYQDEIEKAFDNKEPVNEVAARICAMFDEDYGKASMTPENGYEDFEKEYGKSLPELTKDNEEFEDPYDFSNDYMGESTESKKEDDGLSDGETFDQWKEYVFKYLDKRVDTDKIKELGKYIKDFIKQEYDNGEPSWFACAESIVNYARIKYPDALKDRASNAFSITESVKSPKVWIATFNNENEAMEEYMFAKESGYDTMFDIDIKRNTIIIEDNPKTRKFVQEWLGDRAELVDVSDID